MKPLSELGEWSGGKTPSTAERKFWEDGVIPWISSKDMKVSTLEDTQNHITYCQLCSSHHITGFVYLLVYHQSL